jgi:hypothetical protein
VERNRVVDLDPNDPVRVSYKAPFSTEPIAGGSRARSKFNRATGTITRIVNGTDRIGYMTAGALWEGKKIGKVFTENAEGVSRDNRAPFIPLRRGARDPCARVPNSLPEQTQMGSELDSSVERVMEALARHIADVLERQRAGGGRRLSWRDGGTRIPTVTR